MHVSRGDEQVLARDCSSEAGRGEDYWGYPGEEEGCGGVSNCGADLFYYV